MIRIRNNKTDKFITIKDLIILILNPFVRNISFSVLSDTIQKENAEKEVKQLVDNGINPYKFILDNCVNERLFIITKKLFKVQIDNEYYVYDEFYSGYGLCKKNFEYKEPKFKVGDLIKLNKHIHISNNKSNTIVITEVPIDIKDSKNPLFYQYVYWYVFIDKYGGMFSIDHCEAKESDMIKIGTAKRVSNNKFKINLD